MIEEMQSPESPAPAPSADLESPLPLPQPRRRGRPPKYPAYRPVDGASAGAGAAGDPLLQGDPARTRVSFWLTPDGALDTQALKEETRVKLRAAINTPEVLQALDMSNERAQSLITDEEIDNLIEVYSKIECLAFSKLRKIDADIAERAFTFSDEHKKSFRPLVKPVIAKYLAGNDFYNKYGAEIQAVVTLVIITKAQIQAADVMMQQRYGANWRKGPKNPPQSAPVAEAGADHGSGEVLLSPHVA